MPAEIYSYGSQIYASLITNFIIMFLVNYLYLPVFFELQLNSVYEVCTGSDQTNVSLKKLINNAGYVIHPALLMYLRIFALFFLQKLLSLHCSFDTGSLKQGYNMILYHGSCVEDGRLKSSCFRF